jgi:C1A family cysteine protease
VSGVIDAPPGSKTVGRHAVLAVGANSDTTRTFLIIKNSWGTAWADDGYAQLSQRYFEQYVTDIHTLE